MRRGKMARYIQFRTRDQGTILVEANVEEIEQSEGMVKAGISDKLHQNVVQVQTVFQDAVVQAIRQNVEALVSSVKELSEGINHVEMAFGLKVTGEIGNVAVAKAGGEANITITVTWERHSTDRSMEDAR
jgi:Trypsin-co-occurring domain 1